MEPYATASSPNYDNAAHAGSNISFPCHPPALFEGFMTSNQTFVAGRDQEVALELWADSIKHDTHSASLICYHCAQIVFDRTHKQC